VLAIYPSHVCRIKLPCTSSHARLPQASIDVPAECLLSQWLRTGGIMWDTFRKPLMGFESICLWETPTKAKRCSGGCKPVSPQLHLRMRTS